MALRAINPYLALEASQDMIEDGLLDKDYYAADKGLHQGRSLTASSKSPPKWASSTIQSYQGSQIFEAIGISQEVIDRYFTGTVSRVGGIGLDEIARLMSRPSTTRHSIRWGCTPSRILASVGIHKYRAGQGASTSTARMVIHLLQQLAP